MRFNLISLFISIFLCVPSLCFKAFSSNDSLTLLKKDLDHRVFANIYAAHYHALTERVKPKTAFEMPTAMFGYSATFSNKLKATLIYDVTRTTSNIWALDSEGNPVDIRYFEGSMYTAFLKMAEIKYSINQNIDFRVGQLLNTQYLTTQDRFWGYRYIYFTFQEVHRYGNPADFGAQVDFKYENKVLNQISVTNGEGPFRHQDESGKYLYANNLEFRPTQNLIIKLYTDYAPSPDTSSLAKDRYVVSAFGGYKTDRYRIGFEYNQVYNFGFTSNSNYWGFSTFGSLAMSEKVDFITRYDFVNKSNPLDIDKGHFILTGVHYKPHENFFCSINIRSLNPGSKQWVYANFGVSF